MKICVTGASGRLGRSVCKGLVEAGHAVFGTDREYDERLEVPLKIADLTNREVCYGLLEGMEAVAHLGNLPAPHVADAQTVFNVNVTANMNIFQAAVELGVKNIVFASSIQSVMPEVRYAPREVVEGFRFTEFPIDGAKLPFLATNTYALSKVCGEQSLEYFCREYGITGTSIRLPGIRFKARKQSNCWPQQPPPIWQALSMIHGEDAASLVAAILGSELQGYRSYLPTCNELVEKLGGAQEVVRQHYPEAKIDPSEQWLMDIRQITAETGWIPTHQVKDIVEESG